jgi:hypothetical protein
MPSGVARGLLGVLVVWEAPKKNPGHIAGADLVLLAVVCVTNYLASSLFFNRTVKQFAFQVL